MKKRVFLISGEKSGSNIINQILDKLFTNNSIDDISDIELLGIVDDETAKRFSVRQIFPLHDISVIGIGDILSRIPHIIDRINFTARTIVKTRPDIVISVDAYDFSIRVAKKVKSILRKNFPTGTSIDCIDVVKTDSRKSFDEEHSVDSNGVETKNEVINDKRRDMDIKFWHIVAPTVWAYWSWRARILSKYYNRLFYLLPFEGKFFRPFERLGRNEFLTTFVGYPATFQSRDSDIKKDKNLIGITIGSRISEINRHKNLIISTIMRLSMIDNGYKFVIFATVDTYENIKNAVSGIKNVKVVYKEDEKKRSIQECQIVIAKSGTNNIEIGALGTTMITYYKTSMITYLFAKIFSKTKLINLFNITLGEMVIPELVQGDANTENLAKTVYTLLSNQKLIDAQLDKINRAITVMQREDKARPIDVVAKAISSFLKSSICKNV